MQAYSNDLRKRVLADSDAGLPTKQVAEKYGVACVADRPQRTPTGLNRRNLGQHENDPAAGPGQLVCRANA
jgi:hypothetical protein